MLKVLISLLLCLALGGQSTAACAEKTSAANQSRVGRLWQRTKQGVARPFKLMGGHVTRTADRIEGRLGDRGKAVFAGLRLLSPTTIGSYTLGKFKQDPAFLGTYGTATFSFSMFGYIPALLMLGVDPLTAVGLRLAVGTMPIDATVLFSRQHHLLKRKGETSGFRETLRKMKAEYIEHAVMRRENSRQFLADNQPRKPTMLLNLAKGLDSSKPK
jgi:hypothetical protein